MNAHATKTTALTVVSDDELLPVLKSSLYPGASDGSVRMVLAYCRAASLDVMQKPVHIVPMWDSKAGSMRDVVMPGIGMYRVQAARTGQFAGMSEPEFGPDVETEVGGQRITFPEWCRVTVKRALASGVVAEFTAREYWMENYAVKGGKEKSVAPNAMWTKRPRGQLAKCTQAQALRIAFPEIGAQPTAEELEGKQINEYDAVDVQARVVPSALPQYPDDKFDEHLPDWRQRVEKGSASPQGLVNLLSTKYTLSDEQRDKLMKLGTPAAASRDEFVSDMEKEEQA